MNVGIINDKNHSGNIAIPSFYYAISNIFSNVKLIHNKEELENIDLIFIGNDHFTHHVSIWKNDEFINRCNLLNITVCVYTMELIYSSFYPWNTENQLYIEKFNNLYQRVLDVNDAKKLNKKIGRPLFSKFYENMRIRNTNKIDKAIFIGSLNIPEYNRRIEAIEKISKVLDIDIFKSSNDTTYASYLEQLSKYRFVLSPYSTNLNGLPGRFNESLLVHSIPIQQVYSDTLDLYKKEKEYKDVIFFTEPEEVVEKLKNFELEESINCDWLEDELIEFFTTDVNLKF